jgi:HK97 family phage major capsid protein
MRHRAFPGRGPEIEARYQRAGQWLLATIYQSEKAATWCKTNDVHITKAAGGGIDSNGGFLVPTELSNAILDIRDSYGAFRRRARIIPMASDNTNVPRRTGGANTFFVGGNNTAGINVETNAALDQIGLTAKKIASLIRISSEIEEDAIADIVDFVANEIGFAFAAQEDDCAFNATGTSVYGKMRGISSIVLDGQHAKAKVAAASGHSTFLTLDANDLGALMASVIAAAVPNAAWFCSQTCLAQTLIRIAGGGYLPMAELDGIMTPYFQGFPVILTQKLPLVNTSLSGSVMLAFGDMYMGAALGQRRGITLARSADRYLDQDEIAVLGTERFHSVVHGLGSNTDFGPLAALVGG